MEKNTVSAVILSAGKGTRLKNVIPKQFLLLRGKPVIVYSIEKILSFPEVKELIITYKDDHKQRLNDIIETYVSPEKRNMIKKVKGGETRQESVMNAIKHCKQPVLFLHEAARPLASRKLFEKILYSEDEAVTSGLDVPFTVLQREGSAMTGILNRESIFNVQLPQKFNTAKLLEAHKLAEKNGKIYTDDSSLYFDAGNKVTVIDGEHDNIKITHPKDLIIAERLLEDVYE